MKSVWSVAASRAMLRRREFVRGFRALVADMAVKGDSGPASKLQEFSSVSELPRQDPAADVEVAVTHTTLNYKDASARLFSSHPCGFDALSTYGGACAQ